MALSYSLILGVLGGMGPEATATLYLGLIGRCQSRLGARYNSDFPQIIINSLPVPDGAMWQGFCRSEVAKVLQQGCRLLEAAGAEAIAVPCNSAHAFLPEMREAVKVPVISIVEKTAEVIEAQGLPSVGLLATTFTAESGVHSRELQARRVSLVLPGTADQVVAEEIIVRIESGLRTERDRCRLVEIVARMRERGATGVILGCTEIPLLLSADDLGCPSFDTLEILADSCFRYITGQEEA